MDGQLSQVYHIITDQKPFDPVKDNLDCKVNLDLSDSETAFG